MFSLAYRRYILNRRALAARLLRAILDSGLSSTEDEDGDVEDHDSFSTYSWSISPPVSDLMVSPSDEIPAATLADDIDYPPRD